MRILVAGDFVINKKYAVESIDEDIISLFDQSDFNIINLEAPVTNSDKKIIKTGPHLKADAKSTSDVLRSLQIDLVTLANNHILDYSDKGVSDTLDFCIENNINAVGAGNNIEEAAKAFYLDSDEGLIAIVNFAENEWSGATQKSAGANPMDIVNNCNQIKEAKKKADYVIVIIHGGHEYYNLPSPRMQKQYRFYADCGADLIVGHHTHCISGSEMHKEVPIYYSLGNFLFTDTSPQEDWYIGLILEVLIKNRRLTTKLHPVIQGKNTFSLSFPKEKDSRILSERIETYNEIISNAYLLTKEWQKYMDSKYRNYLNFWSPVTFIKNHYIRAIFRRVNTLFINSLGMSSYLNLMRCEAHRDLSMEIIQKYIRKWK